MGCNCCGSGKTPPIPDISQKLVIAALLWIATYLAWPEFTHWFVFDCLKQNQQEHFGIALEFFLYDTGKILLLLIAMVYIIAWLRAQLNLEKVRVWLQGKGRFTGYAMASLFGAITPFCSCSSIPLFIGFSRASIPFGTTMAFLITSPIINEVAVVILWEVLGWQLTLTYVTIGLLVGILELLPWRTCTSEAHSSHYDIGCSCLGKCIRPQTVCSRTTSIRIVRDSTNRSESHPLGCYWGRHWRCHPWLRS